MGPTASILHPALGTQGPPALPESTRRQPRNLRWGTLYSVEVHTAPLILGSAECIVLKGKRKNPLHGAIFL